MIRSTFITPEAFEKLCRSCDDQPGLDDLRELVFPRRADSNVVIADPHLDNWVNVIAKRIAILPQKDRSSAMTFLEHLQQHALVGWTCTNAVPTDEQGWVRLVKPLSPKLIDWILSCNDESPVEAMISLNHLGDDDWIKDQRSMSRKVERSLDCQRLIIDRLLLGSDWCVAELPYVKGGVNDEGETFSQLITALRDLDYRRPPFSLDLVTDGENASMPHWKSNLEQCIRKALAGDRRISINVFTAPKLRDRYFTAGTKATIAGGVERRIVRWCVAPQHVAISRKPCAENSLWTLCGRKDAVSHWEQLRRTISENLPPKITVNGSAGTE